VLKQLYAAVFMSYVVIVLIIGLQHYVIKVVSDLWQVGGFSVSSTNKTDSHDINELLLKVALNIITK
jgi:hypothetical protein